jgi:hypothetical protein
MSSGFWLFPLTSESDMQHACIAVILRGGSALITTIGRRLAPEPAQFSNLLQPEATASRNFGRQIWLGKDGKEFKEIKDECEEWHQEAVMAMIKKQTREIYDHWRDEGRLSYSFI